MHTAIDACCVTGSGLAQPIALVTLTAEARERARDPRRRRALERSLLDCIERVNEALDPHERLDHLVVLADPWTVDNDLVTPTLKVKRHQVEERFAASYAAWADSGERIVWPHG
jgi:long-chain acyl-CoA synthetase